MNKNGLVRLYCIYKQTMKRLLTFFLLFSQVLLGQTKNYKFCSDKVKPCYAKIVDMKYLDEKEFWIFDSTGSSINVMWLSAVSCGDDLKMLSNDNRPIVKIFGIAARLIKNDSTVYELVEKNKTNNKTFLYNQNGKIIKVKVSDFIKDLIIPNRRLLFEKPIDN